MILIDVIIPSYRLQSEYLIPIVQMDVPSDTKVRYLIIADNPQATIPIEFKSLIDNERVILFRNEENHGAHKSRNIGIDNSTADWILFIDDDVKPSKNLLQTYVSSIKEKPDEVGFFGETLFPEPINRFTRGLIACDILTFFFIAGYYKELKWAPTANVLIKRSAIGDIRFKDIFPKNGGGEDIDFFLQINEVTKKELQCLTNAKVFHSWWYDGKRNYVRFIRWSYGDALLHTIFPQYSYYNFPNVIESLVFGFLLSTTVSLYSGSFLPLVCVMTGIIVGEFLVEFIRMIVNKGLYQSQYAFEGSLVRASNDMGRLYMQLVKLKRIKGICERADHFCDGKHISYQRLWAGLKFSTYIIISAGLLYLAH